MRLAGPAGDSAGPVRWAAWAGCNDSPDFSDFSTAICSMRYTTVRDVAQGMLDAETRQSECSDAECRRCQTRHARSR